MRQVVWNALAVFGLGVLVFHSSFVLCQVHSGSMQPTLVGEDWKNGDWVLCERWTDRWRRPRRWELIVFRNNSGEYICKRVVAFAGESVSMQRDGTLVVNGSALERPQFLQNLKFFPFGNLRGDQAFKCDQGYYVLGDDSRDSDDSRFNGCIPAHFVEARPWMILAPLSRFGRVR